MAADPAIHPSENALRAFSLGKLDQTASAALMNHLDDCPACCKVVAALYGDDFLHRLRQTQGRSFTPAPGKPLAAVAGGTLIVNLPPELAANQQYEVVRELGRGGMGVVYLAQNKLMDRLEVLKIINKTLLDKPGSVERFLREIRSAAKLNHANIVMAYSAVQQGELLAFAMEYIDGQDLASAVKAQGPLPVVNACYYVQQAASGLQHAFEKEMVHRDIKPQNLMLAREGKKHLIKVLDFGLAKATSEKQDDTGLTGVGRMLGTPDYIAPEQCLDAAKADIRADIYSLGCTLYYLLAGRPPFSATSLSAILLAHQMQEAKPLNLVRPEVPEELAAVVRKMMAKSPAKRYQTPLEVVQTLAPFVKKASGVASAPRVASGVASAPRYGSLGALTQPRSPELSSGPPPPVAGTAKQPPEPAAVWESLTEDNSTSIAPRKSKAIRKRRAVTARVRTSRKKWLIGGGIVMSVLLLALVGMWAGGLFELITNSGTLVLEIVPSDVEILVDGETVKRKARFGDTIRLTAGKKHQVAVNKPGFLLFMEDVQIKAGERRPLHVHLRPYLPPNEANGKENQPQPQAKPPLQAKPPPVEVLTPAQAARKVGQKVTVEFRVQATGGNAAGFQELYSEKAWHIAGCMFIRIPNSQLRTYQELGVQDIHRYFRGKRIRVTGTVILLRFGQGTYPCIQVNDPDQFLDPPLRRPR